MCSRKCSAKEFPTTFVVVGEKKKRQNYHTFMNSWKTQHMEPILRLFQSQELVGRSLGIPCVLIFHVRARSNGRTAATALTMPRRGTLSRHPIHGCTFGRRALVLPTAGLITKWLCSAKAILPKT
jgi:hypothetical protein